jgi:uroporphyrin-III C-methyltransferase/precorrin-2 dehydrogenase/sirohydrochlorin ferrochelatase
LEASAWPEAAQFHTYPAFLERVWSGADMAERKLSLFPAFHKVEDRRLVVVGGGEEAAAKVRLLAETSAEILLFAPSIEAATGADLIRAGGSWMPREPAAEDFVGVGLAFIATGDAGADRAAVALARAAGVPVNVVDRPELCDFYTPAIVNRAPLAIAVSTEGAAPVLARHVRARIEAMFAPRFGDLAALAERLRHQVGSALTSPQERRRFWAGFFTGQVAAKVFSGAVAEAETDARKALTAPDRSGHVSLVGAGPGAEDLLTLRAQRALQEADVILFDRLVPEAVVAMGRRDARRIYVGKAKGAHVVSQDQINATLVREARADNRVVRLKSGDPLVFGRAGEEIAALREAGISFDIVPGVTAALAAAADAEIPLTLRGVASTLVFATGHDMDGRTLPDWAGLALSGATVAVYMGKSVAADVSIRLVEAGMPADTPVAIIENASRPERRIIAGALGALPRLVDGPDLAGPVLVIVGDAVAEGRLSPAVEHAIDRVA